MIKTFVLVLVITAALVAPIAATEQGKTAEEFNAQGNALLKEQKYQEAIEQYSKALKIDPQFAKALFNRAQCNYRLKNYAAAIDDWQACVRNAPHDHDAFFWLGKAQMANKLYLSAASSLQDAAKLKEDPGYYAALAEARFYSDDFEKAKKDVGNALALEKGHPAALRVNKMLIDYEKQNRARAQVRAQLNAEREGKEAREQTKQEEARVRKARLGGEPQTVNKERNGYCPIMLALLGIYTNPRSYERGEYPQKAMNDIRTELGFAMQQNCMIEGDDIFCFECTEPGKEPKKIQLRRDPRGHLSASGPFRKCKCDE